MKKIEHLKRLLLKPKYLLLVIDKMGLHFLKDEVFLKLNYEYVFDKKLNLDNPKTFNEKIQWLKLNDRKDIYTTMVDKYEVKKYVSDIIGEDYIIPTLGVYDTFNEIDFDNLPSSFVIKCTHDSGGLVIVKDKDNFNKKKARKIIDKSLKKNFYYKSREWPYKNVKPRIIIEPYLEDKVYNELRDYKFFCFNGKVKLMFIASNRQGEGDTYFDFFDDKFKHLNIKNVHPMNPSIPDKPKGFDKMKELTKILSKDNRMMRVDFYEVNGKIYFGELTLYHWSGFSPFTPEEWDEKIGKFITL